VAAVSSGHPFYSSIGTLSVAETASDSERYTNQRAEYYWQLRQLFETGSIARPDDEDLQDELTQPNYNSVSSNGTILIEEKDEMRKRLGRSPDRADALMLADATPPEEPSVNFGVVSEECAMPWR
jgi:hypothetical protein